MFTGNETSLSSSTQLVFSITLDNILFYSAVAVAVTAQADSATAVWSNV
jgi:hypothetical protein